MELKDSKTWNNLKIAFANESEAHTKYQYYASKAKKEGYNIISSIFEETSKNEKEHAKLWFKYLHGDDVPITKQNLLDAIKGEDYETSVMYREFAEVAKQEGFNEIANLFLLVGDVEQKHMERYQKLLDSLEENKIFDSETPILWICTNCGHIHFGKKPPEKCPVCKHPQGYFVRENRIFK